MVSCYNDIMLELKGINYSAGGKSILKNASFSVKEGEFLGITGPNGSGKSTLAKIIMGIIAPSSGEIIYNGKDISKLGIAARAKKGISYAFQMPVRIKGVTVKDLLECAHEANAIKCLKMVGLNPDEYLNRELDSGLSGGELKRIEVASAIATNAKLIIFDEPEAGIDMWSMDNLIDVFKDLRKEGRTIVVISHNEKILKLADRVEVLNGSQ